MHKLELKHIVISSIVLSFFFLMSTYLGAKSSKPNIIFIFADDMGIGDVSHTTGKAPTPHLDRMAKEGMRFTDAHTSSSVCTPSRYSVMTGRYCWRTHLKKGVYNKPDLYPLIKKGETTIASLLKSKGYHTACIGKWHLGIGWQKLPENQPRKYNTLGWDIDYSKPAITPTSNGFDYFFGITSSLDMPPFLYIENERAISQPTINMKVGSRVGPAVEGFRIDQCLTDFAAKSVSYIHERAESKDPFFLYLPLTSPHTPISPSKNWIGKSGIDKYCDFVMETDWVVGEVLKALDDKGIKDNTLVIFSTDNGSSPGHSDLRERGHYTNGNLRGHKADIFDGGHRVPFLVRWPKVVKPNTETARLTCLTDVISTCSEIVGKKLDAASGVDGVSFLETLKDPNIEERSAIVHHSFGGFFAIRKGKWKLNLCPHSGGWSFPMPGQETADAPKVQLYDMSKDIAETTNLSEQYPTIVNELTALLEQYVQKGRSTAGKPQGNDGEVHIYGPPVEAF